LFYFFIFFGKFIWTKLSNFLDDKILTVRSEIEEAQKLHNDAKILLSKEMKKIQDLEKEMQKILEEGKSKILNLQKENKDNILMEIKKLEKASLEKISYLEHQVITELKQKIANQAMKVSQDFLIKKINTTAQLESISTSIDEIEGSLKNNPNLI
jgi:F-type H+-transporting ATPase subunit b